MKITKIKEYDLESMSRDELQSFLRQHYSFKTEYYVDDRHNCDIAFIYNKNGVVATFKDYKYGQIEGWYRNKIKELENDIKR